MKYFKLLLLTMFAICQNTVAQEQKMPNIVGKTVMGHDSSPAIAVSIFFYSQEEASQLLDIRYDNTSKIDFSSIKFKSYQPPKFHTHTDTNGSFKLTLPRGKYLCLIAYVESPKIWREIEITDELYNLGTETINQDQDATIYIY